MTISKARELSMILGGEAYQADGEEWLVLIERPDGRLVAVSEDSVEEYDNREALDDHRCYACISLA